MKYKLVDVKRMVEEDVEFGTCELCEWIGTHYYDVLILKDENGEVYEIENGYWSWGDYIKMLEDVDNYIILADVMSKHDFKPLSDNYTEFDLLVDMNNTYREHVPYTEDDF